MFSSNTSAVSADAVFVEELFQTHLYTGNGSTQTITNGIDLSGKGGLVWLKGRNTAGTEHELTDTARGTNSNGRALNSNDAQANQLGDLTSFTSSGFGLSYNTANGNLSGESVVSWTFRKQPKFFDVVTYTGNGVAGRTVAHSLGSVPGCIIIKRTNSTGDWAVYHRSLGASASLNLNLPDSAGSGHRWEFTSPTSTQFTVGTGTDVNANGSTYVAYLFAHNAGGFGLTGTDNVISCGSFTVDGSGNSSINLGYEPQWLLMKQTNTTGSWLMQDTMRGQTADNGYSRLLADTSGAETSTTTGFIRINATGFSTNGATGLVGDHIYIAIRRGPMKTPTTGTSVFKPQFGTSGTPSITTPFVVDSVFDGYVVGGFYGSQGVTARLTGNKALATASTAAEDSTYSSYWTYDYSNGVFNNINSSHILWAFGRAPGFFDVVCYTGTGAATTQAHNLGVVPELIITKCRGDAFGWAVYASAVGNTAALFLETTAIPDTNIAYWNNTTPTSTVFTVGNANRTNRNGLGFVAYLFASCPGVSKVGSYTGNGSSQTINCGFTGGARFVMVKRTDSTGNWMVVDTARGLVSASDPTLYLNSTAAEVTGVDWLDPDNSGFIVNQESTMNANVNGATYIYLSIA